MKLGCFTFQSLLQEEQSETHGEWARGRVSTFYEQRQLMKQEVF